MTLIDPPSVAQPFSRQLRDGTATDHQHAESARFVSALMDGTVPRAGIVDLWTQYHWIYAELEATGADLRHDPVVGRFVVDELERTAALEHDLRLMAATGAEGSLDPTPTTERYRARLRELRSWPAGFVAHHYTRYLGDLAGGQVIGRVLSSRSDLVDGELAFPVFDAIPSRPRFREQYRVWLDQVPWDEHERRRVVDEARLAFTLNAQLFEDLAARHLQPLDASDVDAPGQTPGMVSEPTSPAPTA